MPASLVQRPVVRSFKVVHLRAAAEHVRAGGHAIVWEGPKRARFVFQSPKDPETDLGAWGAYDFGIYDWEIVDRGLLKGLASVRVPRKELWIVERRVERDSVIDGATTPVTLDCLACGACCRDNEVILEDKDVERFSEAGRAELARRPWAKRKDGKIILVLQRNKRCKHLLDDNRCDVYAIRPDACSTFPMGSECCLFAREDEMGFKEGLFAQQAGGRRSAAGKPRARAHAEA